MKLLAIDTATHEATVAVTDGDRVLAAAQRTVTSRAIAPRGMSHPPAPEKVNSPGASPPMSARPCVPRGRFVAPAATGFPANTQSGDAPPPQRLPSHSEGLLALIDQVLGDACVGLSQVDAIVCGRGPGSFTGLRIGMATAKGLCLATGLPLVCVGSMVALAAAASEGAGPGCSIVALLDGRRGEVFCGCYRAEQLLGAETVCRPHHVVEHVPKGRLILVGDGALRYRALLLEALPTADLAPAECHAIQAGFLAQAARPAVQARRFDDLQEAVPLYLRPPDIRPPAGGARQ